jgi:hypothetical protein
MITYKLYDVWDALRDGDMDAVALNAVVQDRIQEM